MSDHRAPLPAPLPSGSGPGGGELERAICERARDFELGALLNLLRSKFPDRQLLFRSHSSWGLRATTIHEIEFQVAAVVVTLNLGLFSSTSPLPSYVQEWLTGSEPAPGLEPILAMLDDRLLRDRAEASAVRGSPRLLPRPSALRRNFFQLSRPASSGTLYWLFARLFPELGVSVVRAGVHRAFAAVELRLGEARLGHTAMGGEADVVTPGYDVFLATGESSTWRGEPWASEARRRLTESVFPALSETCVNLRILLFDFQGSMRLSLMRASMLGFDPLARAGSPHVILLHEGKVDENRKSSRDDERAGSAIEVEPLRAS